MKNHFYIIIQVFIILFVSSSCETKNSVISNSDSDVTFTEILTQHPAIDSFYSQAVAVVDLNNDNFPEMYVTNSWTGNHNHFYRNENGSFVKDTLALFARDNGFSNGCSFVDIDNNGVIDLCVANFNNEPNRVYFGDKNGNYKRLEIEPSNTESWSYGTSFVDIDNDGTLELYVANYKNQQNKLYTINNHEFRSIASDIVTPYYNSSLNASWSDLNNDNLQDLIVCNESVNQLFQNLGDFKFKLIQSKLTADTTNTYGCSIADYNNDGLMDVFIVNFIGQNWLYKNLGNFKFEKITTPFSDDYNFSEGSCWGDYNNDGYTDICVTNEGENVLYKNINGETFEKQTLKGFSDTIINSNGIVWVDYDLDGDLDLYVANGGNQRNQFFENSGNANHWVKIKLEGTISNRSAIGAKVIVYSGSLVQYQEVQSQSGGGCGSQKQLMLHFGLGQNTKVDSVQIKWPSSPMSTELNLTSNSIHTITE